MMGHDRHLRRRFVSRAGTPRTTLLPARLTAVTAQIRLTSASDVPPDPLTNASFCALYSGESALNRCANRMRSLPASDSMPRSPQEAAAVIADRARRSASPHRAPTLRTTTAVCDT